jgi:hypothetical protein
MPYYHTWTDPEVVVEHKDVKIYVAYNEQELDEPMMFWFTVDRMGEFRFDIRDLETKGNVETVEERLDILRLAIEAGELPAIAGYDYRKDGYDSQPALP